MTNYGFDVEFEIGKFERGQTDVPIIPFFFGGLLADERKREKKRKKQWWLWMYSPELREYQKLLKEKLQQ